MCFAVTKVNQRGRKQARMLRLTEVGIENVRVKTSEASSIFEYESVTKIVANSISQFTVVYERAKHPYVYQSLVAIQIVQEISQRVRAARQRGGVSRFNAANYQLELQAEARHGTPSAARLRSSLRRISVGGATTHADAAALLQTAEERITSLLWYVTNERNSEEGQALRRFLRSEARTTGALLANNTRAFLDGLVLHVLHTRDAQLHAAAGETIFKGPDAQHKQQALVRRIVTAILEMATLPTLLPRLRDHMDVETRERDAQFRAGCAAVQGRSQEQMRIAAPFRSAVNFAESVAELRELDAQELPSEVLETLLDCVKSIYREGMAASPGGAAVIGGDTFLDILVFVVAQTQLQRPFLKLAVRLPVLFFVRRRHVSLLMSTRAQFAWALCDPQQLQSEGGYYLTVFESAVTFIASHAAT